MLVTQIYVHELVWNIIHYDLRKIIKIHYPLMIFPKLRGHKLKTSKLVHQPTYLDRSKLAHNIHKMCC